MTKFDLLKASNDGHYYDNKSYVGSENHLVSEEFQGKFTKPRTRFIILAIIVIVVVALIVGLVVGLNKSTDDSENNKGNQDAQGGSSATPTSTIQQTTYTQQWTTAQTQRTSTTENNKQSTASTLSVTATAPSTTERVTTTSGSVDWLSEPCASKATEECPWSENPVLLVSLDGFRAEYLLRNLTPHIEKLRECGVHTPYMRAAYPTLTFPNHYTIVTGMYPESHGIVGNKMYDPEKNRSFTMGGQEKFQPYWWGGEPLWITAMKQGKKTASYFWVGSDMNISGYHPNIWKPYNGSVPYESRVDDVLDWLKLPNEDRPDFTTLYFDEPDHTGHGHGPVSEEVDTMLGRMDGVVGYLMNSLLRHRLDHCVNLIILADHGMASTSCERQVNLDHYMPQVDEMLTYSGTTGYIHTKYRKEGSVVQENTDVVPTQEVLDSLQCKSSHLRLFSHSNIPVRHHYSNNARIGDVVVDIEQSWLFSPKASKSCLKGNHGFDNIYKSMHAMFLAHGPGFKQGVTTEPFENIELYNMMAALLNITPAPNNGTFGSLNHLLRSPAQVTDVPIQMPLCDNSIEQTCPCHSSYGSSESGAGIFPWGIPSREGVSMCLLHGMQLAAVYNPVYKTASSVFFPLTAEQVTTYSNINDDCLSSETNCPQLRNSDANIVPARLFNPGFIVNKTDIENALTWWNKVPMYTGFRDGIWMYVWRVVQEYATQYGAIHVTTGPAYDYNANGLLDVELSNNTMYVDNTSAVPLPSHIYMILVKCSDVAKSPAQCPDDQLQVLSFALPHQNSTNNCLPDREFLLNNVVRVRDIEHLTGHRFFPAMEASLSARLRTFLPTELWPSPLLTPWEELPCPIPDDTSCPAGPKPLLLISLDGFRAEYFHRHLTPTIERLSRCGVHTPYMRSVYPTVTFPNHYTIVTGLYPESHGITGNNMYDEEIDKIFSLSAFTAKDPRWWKGEPMWITAKKQGRKTATYFWPGSDVNISGIYPDFWKPYNGKVGYPERVQEVLDWITMEPDERPDFITLYFDEPDHAGHNSGPESDEVNGQLQTVDKLINIIMTNLYENNLHNCVNMIIIADHGMSPQSCDRTVSVKDFYPNITNMLMFDRTTGQIFPQFQKDSRYDASRLNTSYIPEEIVDSLMCKDSNMKVFTKDTLPKRHHYTNSDRIGEVLIDMKDEWLVLQDTTSWCTGGNHGWDNTYKNMHAIFLAHGPAFKENLTANPFENIELYDLMAEVMGITPSPNNGTVGSLHYMLREAPVPNDTTTLSDYQACPVPETGGQLEPLCGCSSDTNVSSDDVFLNVNTDGHVPDVTVSDSVCVLNQTGYTLGYSQTFQAPVWINAVLKNQSTHMDATCVVNDIRVANNPCTLVFNHSDTIRMVPLSRFLSKDGVHLSSATVPLYDGFYKGIYEYVDELISDYLNIYGDLSVTWGTIYDYNNDGLWEGTTNATKYADVHKQQPLPSHVYVVLIKCRNHGDEIPCSGDLDILPFILPNVPATPNCLSSNVYLKDNVARIRDIELLSGLRFMTSYELPVSARLRTYLPEQLWTSSLIKTWSELPCPQQDLCQSDYRPTLLISLDGFRADYLLRNVTPTISRLSECGVHAPYMRSVYPTKTFPNHYTVVTGLYPESHGIIDNNMYDRHIDERFSMSSQTAKDARWWGGEPIWLTAKRQGLRTATYFWPGSDVAINGEYPDIWKHYDGKVHYSTRVRDVVSWMSLPANERPDFITLYFDEPDLAGHKNGPSDQDAIAEALQRVDDTLAELMNALFDRKLHHCVNLVVIADHGMADVSCQQIVRLRDHVDYDYLSANFFVWEGPFGKIADTYIYNRTSRSISAVDEPADSVGLVSNLTCASPHMNIYRKSTLPVRHHYSNNERIDDMILDMETGWLVTRSYINTCRGGNHGYDNIYKSMEALFLAYGPAFKWNITIEPFENIELYNMFADILNITAAPNNGTKGALRHILQQPIMSNTKEMVTDYQKAVLQFNTLEEYVNYVKTHPCYQTCTGSADNMLDQLYHAIPMTNVTQHHTPLGEPFIRTVHNTSRIVALLPLPGATVAYDIHLQTPIWVSQTLNIDMNWDNSTTGCLVPDPRLLSDNSSCTADPNVVTSSLLWGVPNGPEMSVYKYLSSGMVKMGVLFKSKIWTPLQEYIRSIITTETNIVVGPVFDYNHDSLPDDHVNISSSAVPSHFFIVLIQCTGAQLTLNNCPTEDIKLSSYILPHSENVTLCKDFSTYLLENEARLRDVDLITGLNMLTDLSTDISAILKTRLPVSRV